jgi:dTDP-4-dehydrorhamnose reductase
MNRKVLVLGNRGMLGSSVIVTLESSDRLDVVGTSRNSNHGIPFNPEINDLRGLISSVKPDYVINCIGVIKQRISLGNVSTSSVVRINSLFPHEISELSNEFNYKLLQIGTDCVFSGKTGKYREDKTHDSTDLYGRTKSLGEPTSQNSMILRTSFIGPEIENKHSFFEWIKNSPTDSVLRGFTNHLWNGVTSYALSKILLKIITEDAFFSGVHHLVPSDEISKFELINSIIQKTKRGDLDVVPVESLDSIDRTLTTINPARNSELWKLIGYKSLPSIKELIDEIRL